MIVLDLSTGDAFRILNGEHSTSVDPEFLPKVEGQILVNRDKTGKVSPWQVAADGIALSPDGKVLYFCPLSSRHLYSIETDLIFDKNIKANDLEKHVKDWGEKGASDGMATAVDGTIYAGDYEIIVFVLLIRMGQWKQSFMAHRFFGPIHYQLVLINICTSPLISCNDNQASIMGKIYAKNHIVYFVY